MQRGDLLLGEVPGTGLRWRGREIDGTLIHKGNRLLDFSSAFTIVGTGTSLLTTTDCRQHAGTMSGKRPCYLFFCVRCHPQYFVLRQGGSNELWVSARGSAWRFTWNAPLPLRAAYMGVFSDPPRT